jgi:integrase
VGLVGGIVANQINRLSSLKINNLVQHGYHHDGGGLYLQVSNNRNRSWIFRYTKSGKSRELGLGSFQYISLAEARLKRDALKKMLIEGVDPLIEKRKVRKEIETAAAKKITFEACAVEYIKTHKVKWKNAKHASQWESTLRTYAFPVFGHLSVDEIDTQLVLKALKPIWTTIAETASRVRNRVEIVLNWAKVSGFRDGENPARWSGHLENILPSRSEIQKTKHFKALPYGLISNFLTDLKNQPGIAALGLEFLILTCTRTNEVMGACWSEIDFEKKLWIIPPARMKTGREHRVPLSDRALKVLEKIDRKNINPLIFQNERSGKKLSSTAFLALLKRMNYNITAHGFRSTFRDWAGETTNHPREVAEAALAHVLNGKVEAAYQRGDYINKRFLLMEDWAAFCYSDNNILSRLGVK